MNECLQAGIMNRVFLYVAVAYGLSLILGAFVGLTGGHDSPYIAMGYLSMFFPTIAVICVCALFRERAQFHWDRFPVKYLPLALFLMPVLMHVSMLFLTALVERSHYLD